MTQEEYWYWFCTMGHLTDGIKRQILDVYASVEELFEADAGEIIEKTGLQEGSVKEITASRDKSRISEELFRLKDKGIKFISAGDRDFPERLKSIPDCPMCIYLKGRLPDNGIPTVGMVGARACSGYGREFAGKYAGRIAGCGIPIVSGMALGIDSVCARSALDSGGSTIAVLGSGIDVIYPRENIELYYSIITRGGGIISEYPPGTPPLAWQFPHRNRLIAGLSDKLIVIEAGKRSGTLSTAMHALDQGKDVWALPGRVNDRLSRGCNELISDGAGILNDIEQFIESMNIPIPEAGQGNDVSVQHPMTEKERVLAAVGYEPDAIINISKKAGTDTVKTVEILTELELEGLVRNVSGSFYARC